ncbi:hypothetical protein Tco_0089797 [Tanacetum coccineum]
MVVSSADERDDAGGGGVWLKKRRGFSHGETEKVMAHPGNEVLTKLNQVVPLGVKSEKVVLNIKQGKSSSNSINLTVSCTDSTGAQTLTTTNIMFCHDQSMVCGEGICWSYVVIGFMQYRRLPIMWKMVCFIVAWKLRSVSAILVGWTGATAGAFSGLASLFGKLKYEENLIYSIYETKKQKSLATASPLSTAFFSTSIVQDFEDSPDDEEDTSSQEYLNDLEEEYQERSLLAKSKRFFKKGSQRFSSAKATDDIKRELRPTKDFEAKYNKVKAKLALLSSSALTSKSSMVKNKGLVAEAYEWDEEDVSSDYNKMVEVKVLMALVDDENVVICKESAKNGECVKILMKKCDIKKPIWYLDSGCSRRMTGVKSYLHKYVEQSGPKVVFGDDSTCTTEGHGSIKYQLRKFDEKADDGYFLGYSLVSKAFRVFNIRRQQTEETYHITFDESTEAIKFSKPLVDDINIAESERYPPDEYLHPYDPSQRYQVDSNAV